MLMFSSCNWMFVFQGIFLSTFVASNAYVLAPKDAVMNSPDALDQYIPLRNLNQQSADHYQSEDENRLTEKIIEWLDQLEELDRSRGTNQAQQPGVEQLMTSFVDPDLKSIRDRRQVMGIFDNNFFKHKDAALVEKFKTKTIGQSKGSGGCMGALLRVGISSIEQLIEAKQFCSLQA